MGTPESIAVIGAGVGGLAAALAIRRAGRKVVVYERAAELRAVGGALLLWPNAVAACQELGLQAALRNEGANIHSTAFRTLGGESIWQMEHAQLGPGGGPALLVERGHLLRILADALGPSRIRFGSKFESFRQTKRGVHVVFDNGRRFHAGLVGADGLHSAVRLLRQGPEVRRPAKQIAWVGICRETAQDPPAGIAWAVTGGRLRFWMARVSTGGIYWYATLPPPRSYEARSLQRVAMAYRISGPDSPIPDIIAQTSIDQARRTVVTDRPATTAPWSKDRVTLLGDAAHPMTPDLGQGACQALEAAAHLQEALASKDASVTTAFAEYERAHRPRATRIAELSYWTAAAGRAMRGSLGDAHRGLIARGLPIVAGRELGWILAGRHTQPPEPIASAGDH